MSVPCQDPGKPRSADGFSKRGRVRTSEPARNVVYSVRQKNTGGNHVQAVLQCPIGTSYGVAKRAAIEGCSGIQEITRCLSDGGRLMVPTERPIRAD